MFREQQWQKLRWEHTWLVQGKEVGQSPPWGKELEIVVGDMTMVEGVGRL